MFPLPKLTPELSRVLCYRVTKTDAKSLCIDSQIKRNEMMWNWLFDMDALTLSNVWIFDLVNMDSMAYWSHINMSFLKKVLKISLVIRNNSDYKHHTYKILVLIYVLYINT